MSGGDNGRGPPAPMGGSGDSNGPGTSQYSHIESLLRALHQPNINVSRPLGGEVAIPMSLMPAATTGMSLLGNIEEQMEETQSIIDEPMRPTLPVLFDIESISETSTNPPSPEPSTANLEEPCEGVANIGDEKRTSPKKALPNKVPSCPTKQEENLERFNKSVISVMDTLMHSRGGGHSPGSLTPSASTGKPFAFYHRMHRHSSANSLNIPNIVVTGSGDPQQAQHHNNHHLKRFTFGLRRHSHAVVGFNDMDWAEAVIVREWPAGYFNNRNDVCLLTCAD